VSGHVRRAPRHVVRPDAALAGGQAPTLQVPVQPAQRISFQVTADALGRWAWHCHLLFHMDAGMFREVVVS